MSHVVACDLKATAHATHQARVHGAEAAEIHVFRQAEFLHNRLEMTMKQVVGIERIAFLVGEHEILWLTEILVAFPHHTQSSEDDAVPIERDFSVACFCLHVVKHAVVHAFVHDDAIWKAIFPAQRKHLSRSHRGENDADQQRTCWLRDQLENPSDLHQGQQHRWFHRTLSRQLYANRRILFQHSPRDALIESRAKGGMDQPDGLWCESRRKRVEVGLQLNPRELPDLDLPNRGKQIRTEVLLVAFGGGVLQMRPRQFPALVVDGSHGLLVTGEQMGFVVAGVDPFHELVGPALCFALARHHAFRPGFGTPPTCTAARVVPVINFPFRPFVLDLGSLVSFLHHGPPSVVLQSRSTFSIEGDHCTTSEPPRKRLITAGRNRT